MPQSAIRHAEHANSLQKFEPGTARARERPQKNIPEAHEGCVLRRFSRRSRVSPRKRGRGDSRPRNRQLAGSNLHSADPQSAQAFAIGARAARINSAAKIGSGATAHLDEAAGQASPRGRAALSKAWNQPEDGDPKPQGPRPRQRMQQQ
eukprot:8018860-Alexandrium_andersonii.AAC.1